MEETLTSTLLQEIHPAELLVLAAAFLGVLGLLYRLGFSTNLGLLTAGIAAGSLELNFLVHEEVMHGLAEVGALFLLFLTSARCRYRLVASGTSGVKFTLVYVGLATTSAAMLLRFLGLSWQESIFSALLLSFTCTPITITLLSSSRASAKSSGVFDRTVLTQILIVLIVLPLVPVMGSQPVEPREIVRMYLVGLPVIGIAFILAGRWLPETVRKIERESTEEAAFIKVCTILGLPLLLAYALGLPVAFGAVTSGVLASETRFRGRTIGDVVSLRWIMAALFLVPLGILFDYRVLMTELVVIGGTLTGILVLKMAFLAAAAVIIHQNWKKGLQLNVHLLPIGAFSFLIFAEGRSYGLMPGGQATGGEQLFVAVTVLLFLAYALATLTIASSRPEASSRNTRSAAKNDPLDRVVRGRYGQLREQLFGYRQNEQERARRKDPADHLSHHEIPVLARDLPIFLWDVEVERGAPIAGSTVEELYRHPRFNLVLVSLWRSDVCYADPPPGLRLRPADRLIVSGTPREYLDGGELFSRPKGSDADGWESPSCS